MKNSEFKMLLGMDFFVQNKITLDFMTSGLKFKDKVITFLPEETTEDIKCEATLVEENISENIQTTEDIKCEATLVQENISESIDCNNKHDLNKVSVNYVRTTQKIKLKPGESKIITMKCDQNLNENKSVAITTLDNVKFHEPNSIHTVTNGRVNTIITNHTPHDIHINKGQRIGFVEKDWEQTIGEETNIMINNVNIDKDMLIQRKQELNASDFDLNHLTESERQEILPFMMKNFAVFSKSYKTLGATDAITPKLELLHEYPIALKPYPLPNKLLDVAEGELRQLQEAGIIESTMSSYAFPIIFVKKKSKGEQKYRMAIDFRLLNEITMLYKVAIPKIKEIVQTISGFKYYTTVDLKAAFMQIILPPEVAERCAITTHIGNFKIKRMPFGLRNSAPWFSTLMQKVFAKIPKQGFAYYLDDIIIGGNSIEELKTRMQLLFSRLQEFNLTLDPNKIQLFQKRVEVLGFEISQHGAKPSINNINKINQFPPPKNVKEVKSFLGLTNYFRHLIKDYASIVQPLTELTKKGKEFTWDERVNNAFNNLQQIVADQPTIHKIIPGKPFYVFTDASSIALAGILTQMNKEGKHVPIEYFSRKLSDTEKNYASWKLELYAIYETIKNFHEHLFGESFTIITDAKILKHNIDMAKQHPCVVRWLMFLQQYDFKMEHIKGELNPADYLSRQVFNLNVEPTLENDERAISLQSIKTEQELDSEIKDIITKINNGETVKIGKKKGYFINEEHNILMLKDRGHNKIVIPQKMKTKIIKIAHFSHLGIRKTIDLIQRKYFWKGIVQDVEQFCKQCLQCIEFKSKKIIPNVPAPMEDINYKSEILAIDLVGPLPRSLKGHHYILTIMDMYSRFANAYPIKKPTSTEIILKLQDHFSKFGLPNEILSDNGSQFISKEFKEFLERMAIKQRNTSIYNPCANGRLERIHGNLKDSLACMATKTFKWHTFLQWYILYHNSSTNSSTKYAPAEIYLGRHLKLPGEVQYLDSDSNMNYEEYIKNKMDKCREIQQHVEQNQQRINSKYLQKAGKFKPKNYQVGDTCYMKNFNNRGALKPKFKGPFVIKRILRNGNVIIQEENSMSTTKIHYKHLKIVPKEQTIAPGEITEQVLNNYIKTMKDNYAEFRQQQLIEVLEILNKQC
jgi:hypothetical protein